MDLFLSLGRRVITQEMQLVITFNGNRKKGGCQGPGGRRHRSHSMRVEFQKTFQRSAAQQCAYN